MNRRPHPMRSLPGGRSNATSGYHPGRRILTMGLVLVVLAGGLVVQLLRIQLVERDRYVTFGDEQWSRFEDVSGTRGSLLDRNGEELAVSVPNPMIWVDPRAVIDARSEAEALAPILAMPVADVEAILTAPAANDVQFRYLQRRADPAAAAQVAQLGLGGVHVGEEQARFLPNGNLARSVIGTTDTDQLGTSGIEDQYESILAGTAGVAFSERSIDGRTIPDTERIVEPATDGADVVLTIDRALQFEVEQSLSRAVEENHAESGVVVITQPATGEILAMASVTRTEDDEIVQTSENRAVTWTYEPASVMKALTFSTVLDLGLASPSTTRQIPHQIDLYDETFTDDEDYESMPMSTTDILVRSSNTGTITWATEVGADRLHDYFRAFGLGRPTGLGFPYESQGLFADVADWSGTDIASIALGQGISVTPLQMLAAYNTIANGGLYVSPRLVKEIREGEAVRTPDTTPVRRVLNERTASNMRDILERVVAEGTAQRASVPGYDVAAKTGTARKPQESGGYTDENGAYHYVATVAGFFPAEHPEFSMIVIIDEPTPDFYASRVSAPLFGELAAWTLRHYQVSPPTDLVFDDQLAVPPSEDPARREVIGTDDGELAAGPGTDGGR